uniref:Aminoacyl-tRNA synthetase class Ia domain-containing protein n=1 Tax=Rhizophagus irregularis (strain DAOM 181602 / DAOM 197198 / MUCL 43194) TaxID=747089 RepID=U9T4B2_RHIID
MDNVWFDSDFYLKQTKKRISRQFQIYIWKEVISIMNVTINDKALYSTLITHGFVMDEQSKKMSKSLGNNKPVYGVDVLRLWVASLDVNDVNIVKNIMSQVGKNIQKYRNTARFMLGNLNNFKYNQLVEYEELDLIDKYMLHETYNLGKNIKIFYL